MAWAKLGSCCWRQWPWYDLYNASRARRGERSPMALRVAQALPPPQLAEQAPHAILHRFAPPRMGLAFLAGAPPTRRPPGTLSIAEHPLNAARRRSNDLIKASPSSFWLQWFSDGGRFCSYDPMEASATTASAPTEARARASTSTKDQGVFPTESGYAAGGDGGQRTSVHASCTHRGSGRGLSAY